MDCDKLKEILEGHIESYKKIVKYNEEHKQYAMALENSAQVDAWELVILIIDNDEDEDE